VFIVFATLMGVCIVLAWVRGSWRYVAATAVLIGLAAAFVVVNDGWYGYGWGEDGVTMNLVVGGAMLASAAAGVILQRQSR